CQHTYGTPYSV
nr:immunoglobulin light chain junction region [Macaca mulatta]